MEEFREMLPQVPSLIAELSAASTNQVHVPSRGRVNHGIDPSGWRTSIVAKVTAVCVPVIPVCAGRVAGGAVAAQLIRPELLGRELVAEAGPDLSTLWVSLWRSVWSIGVGRRRRNACGDVELGTRQLTPSVSEAVPSLKDCPPL